MEILMMDLPLDDAMHGQIKAAVDVLANSGVAAIPTDTLYGLAASAFDESAVLKIYELKGRPERMALPLLLSNAEDVRMCAENVPQTAWALMERFWPGALTLVISKSASIPDIVTAGLDTVALRVPDHPIPRAIANTLGAPITGTSANLSGNQGLANAADVRREFGDTIDFVLDGEDAPGGVASTIVDVSGDDLRVLRDGAVSREELEAVLGKELK
jgi:L-threonylcarbamoyladenylate synthase